MTDSNGPAQTPAPGRIAERKQRTRGAILAAAARLFSRQGYDATTMQEIAALADVGIGTVYGYFPSKEEVLRTALAARREAAAAEGAAALHDVRGAVDRACLLLRQVWEYFDANRQLALAAMALDAAQPDAHRPDQVDLYAALTEMLRRGQERGEVAPAPAATLARALLTSYTWAALRLGIWREAGPPAAVLADLEALTRRLLTP